MNLQQTSRRTVLGAGAAALLLPTAALAHGAVANLKLHKDLDDLARFVGRWEGVGEGQPGKSAVSRSYEAKLGGRFLHSHNRSTYAPQEKNPKGEVHDDVGFFSFDKARKRFVLRQFNVEGYVNTFVATTPSFENGVLIVESESIENIPAGWRARETYRFAGADAFEEIFELAEPGKTFELYAHNKLKRV